jgi:hypothetical protein
VNPSMEAAGKTSLFFTPREMPSRSDLLRTVDQFVNNSD